jgi:hypothetical protein
MNSQESFGTLIPDPLKKKTSAGRSYIYRTSSVEFYC